MQKSPQEFRRERKGPKVWVPQELSISMRIFVWMSAGIGAIIQSLRIVVDTSVIVSALISETGASREVIRRCFLGKDIPIIGDKLFCESEDVLRRPQIKNRCPLTDKERDEFLNAFATVAELTDVFFLWRPNLPDEGDNHLIELAVAGGAEAIVTLNTKDFKNAQLRFDFKVMTPSEFLKRSQ